MACLAGSAYLLGGHASADFPRSFVLADTNTSTLWALRRDSTWRRVSAGGVPPPPLAYASMTAYGEDLFLFGGVSTRQQLLPSLWRFRTMDMSWALEITLDVARYMHTLVAVSSTRLFLHGGYGAAVGSGECACAGCKAARMWSDERCSLQLPYACTRNSSFRPPPTNASLVTPSAAQQGAPPPSWGCEVVRINGSTRADGLYTKTDFVSSLQPVYAAHTGMYLYFFEGYWVVSSEYTSVVLVAQDPRAALLYIEAPKGGLPQTAAGIWRENINGTWVSRDVAATCEVSDSYFCRGGRVLRGKCWSSLMGAATYDMAASHCALVWNGTLALLDSGADAAYLDELTLTAPAWIGLKWHGAALR